MKEKEEFGEYEKLADMLRTIDLSDKSKVRDSLKNRLLSKTAEQRKSFHPWRWLLPAVAAAAAALLVTVNIGHKKAGEETPYYQVPDAGYDIYGVCGRQGLKDYLSILRF